MIQPLFVKMASTQTEMPMDYTIEEKTLTANDALQIHLAPAEGFLIRMKKE